MISAITGLPGNGKGLYSMRSLARRLETTDRWQLTTMTEIREQRLAEYLEARKPGRATHVSQRLRFIDKEDTGQFYRFRGHLTLPPPPRISKAMSDSEVDLLLAEYFKPITEGQPDYHGCDYIITEAHRHFRSEAWSEMSRVMTFYLTQHRHFDDNFTWESQLPKQVVVQLRDLTEQCTEMRNHKKRRVLRYFTQPGGFTAFHYYRVPKTESAEPDWKEEFPLDKEGIASCYNTRGAVSNATIGTPETDMTRKGLPFWALIVGCVLAIAAVIGAIAMVPAITQKSLGWLLKGTQDATKAALKDSLPPTKAPPPRSPANNQLPRAEPAPTTQQTSIVPHVVGYVQRGGQLIVQLSDGTRRTVGTDMIRQIRIKGEVFNFPEKVPTSEQKTEAGLTQRPQPLQSPRHEETNQQQTRGGSP